MNRRPAVADRPRELQPAQCAGHLNVGKNDTDVVSVLQDPDRGVSIGRFQNCIASVLQHVDSANANNRFVLNDEDCDFFQRLVLP